MPTDANPLRREIDEVIRRRACSAKLLEQEKSEPANRVAAARDDSEIGPGIKIIFDRQEEDFRGSAPAAQFRAIGVAQPAHVAQQMPIARAKGKQVAATAMVRSENEPMLLELCKGPPDVSRGETRTIAADCDNFIVTQRCDFLEGILETLSESISRLRVAPSGAFASAASREDVNFRFRATESVVSHGMKKRANSLGEATTRQVELQRICEDKNRLAR